MDTTVLYSLITFASATIALIIKYSYQSKCKTIKCCCGLIDIVRDTGIEKQEAELTSPPSPSRQPSQRFASL